MVASCRAVAADTAGVMGVGQCGSCDAAAAPLARGRGVCYTLKAPGGNRAQRARGGVVPHTVSVCVCVGGGCDAAMVVMCMCVCVPGGGGGGEQKF